MLEDFEYEDFKRWLKEHNDNDVIGYSQCASCCPITTYIEDSFVDSERYMVFTNSFMIEIVEENYQIYSMGTPQWVVDLINHVDGEYEEDEPIHKKDLNFLL